MTDPSSPATFNRNRLFYGVCLAVIPTGAAFAIIANVMSQLKTDFILTNSQVGAIAGAALWGMAISLLVLGPLLEGFGMKVATLLAFLGHISGVSLMIAAAKFTHSPETGFWLLMSGAVLLAGGNGMIEVAGNPLTTALFPEDKTRKLNVFHGFFPVAMLITSLLCWLLNKSEGVANGFFYHWTFQLSLIYIPVLVYGIMVFPQKFPKTENAEAGLPVKEMFRYTFTSPLMYGMLLMMGIAISIEMGVNRWIPPIFGAIDLPGVLMFAWISFIMMTLRFFAGHFISRLSPPGMLAISSVFMALGLIFFSRAQGNVTAFLASTFFAFGVAFFFPTMVGLVSERLPKTGSLGIVLICGFGLGSAGLIGTQGIGIVADNQLSEYLNEERSAPTLALLESVNNTFPLYQSQAAAVADPISEFGYVDSDIGTALKYSIGAKKDFDQQGGKIAGAATPQALRAISGAVLHLDPKIQEQGAALLGVNPMDPKAIQEFTASGAAQSAVIAGGILGPAEGFGGQRAFIRLAWIPLVLTVFFGAMYFNDKRKGGYKAVRLGTSH